MVSAGDPARTFERSARRKGRAALEAARRNFEARHALLAGHRGRLAGTDRLDKGEKLGAQRLVVDPDGIERRS